MASITTPETSSDQQLVYRVVVLHNREAFDTLYLRYIERIRKFIGFKISRPEDVEDLCADVFWRTWQYLTTKEGVDIKHFRAFLYQVARNAVANFYRSQGRIPEMMDIDDPEEYTEIKDSRIGILEEHLRAQDIDALVEAVQKLREPLREVIALRFFEELEMQEIAEVIGKKQGNVRVLIHRGVRELQKIIGFTI